MTKEIYKCSICGKIIEIIHNGQGQLKCCETPMKKLDENSTDAAKEKHIPIIEGNQVIVSQTLHPMTQDHYIEWIEATSKTGEIAKVFLSPNQEPKATFSFEPVSARAYCNLHFLWKNK